MANLEQIVSLNALNRCSLLCTKQSRWKDATQRYLANMLVNNVQLHDDIIDGTYSVMPTTDFEINERGRIRKIEAPAIRDKNLQKTLTINVLLPNIRPYLIYDNYASLKSRGTFVKDHNTCNRTLKGMDELFHRLFPNPAKREKERRSLLAKGINRGAETKDLKYCLTTQSNYYGR